MDRGVARVNGDFGGGGGVSAATGRDRGVRGSTGASDLRGDAGAARASWARGAGMSAALLLLAVLAGCAAAPRSNASFDDATAQRANARSGAAAADASLDADAQSLVKRLSGPVMPTQATEEYLIGPQDLIEISVYQVPDLTRKVRVNTRGGIALPLVGQIKAEGMTVEQLEQEIARRLEEQYMQAPQVTVFVQEYNSQRITVEGAIGRPGMYPLTGRTSLLQLIAIAGGTQDIANERQIAIFRDTQQGRVVGMFDLKKIRSGKAKDPEVKPNDIVVVDRSGPRSFLRRVMETVPGVMLIGGIF
jgi:polysaccharide export outer membrane protein